MNGFLEPESPNFDPNHAFLSSIEAEIIAFLPKKKGALIRSVTVTQKIDLNRPHYYMYIRFTFW